MVALSIETLRSRFLGISREPQTPRSDVTSALPSGLTLRFMFVWLDHALEVSDLPQGFPPGGGRTRYIPGWEVQRGPSYPDPV